MDRDKHNIKDYDRDRDRVKDSRRDRFVCGAFTLSTQNVASTNYCEKQ